MRSKREMETFNNIMAKLEVIPKGVLWERGYFKGLQDSILLPRRFVYYNMFVVLTKIFPKITVDEIFEMMSIGVKEETIKRQLLKATIT